MQMNEDASYQQFLQFIRFGDAFRLGRVEIQEEKNLSQVSEQSRKCAFSTGSLL